MKKAILLIIPIFLSVLVFVAGYFSVKYALQLPFRSTNDELHKKNSPLTLDILIPAGTYLDEKITIGQVINLRLKKEGSIFNKSLRIISEMIPARYRYLADFVLLFFWSFLYMTFLRIFTFMGYARALRVSLFLGGCTYFFMPDFSPGKIDDVLFIAIPVFIILLGGGIKKILNSVSLSLLVFFTAFEICASMNHVGGSVVVLPASGTLSIQNAIDTLPAEGGSIRIHAGEYTLGQWKK